MIVMAFKILSPKNLAKMWQNIGKKLAKNWLNFGVFG
jgi:hypothetical protein